MSMSQSSSESFSYSSNNHCCCCHRSFSENWNYCPYCGRPINIGISRGSTVPSCGTTRGCEPSQETTGISIGHSGGESGWTKDIGTNSTGFSSNTEGTSCSSN